MYVADQRAELATGNRRSFFAGLSKFTLSATAIALLAGRDRLALIGSAKAETPDNDIAILNAALAAEQEAIAVYQLGGTPNEAKASYSFPIQKLKDRADVPAFAAELERGAVSAYLGAVTILADRELAKAAASILGDEAMHWAVLRQALGQNPVPTAFLS
jgi:hypothetical protein